MKVWLINPYGPIPGEGWRDFRFTMIAEALAQQGHQVTWWTANFSHHFKKFRSVGWIDKEVDTDFRIRLVPTSGYSSNVSFARILFEFLFVWRMYQRAVREDRPDLIISTDPPQFMSYTAVKLARKLETPLVLDFGDLWPELFILAFPPPLRRISNLMMFPLYALRRYSLRRADAVIATCDTYLELARRESPNLVSGNSATVFLGVDVGGLREKRLSDAEVLSLSQRLGKSRHETWAIFAGTLGSNYDIDALLYASSELQRRDCPIKIVIAGSGPFDTRIASFVQLNPAANLVYLGNLDSEFLDQVYQICGIGLCAYAAQSTVAMPVKVFDYLAAGLPIVSSLPGELERLLRDQRIGLNYAAGDPISLVDVLVRISADVKQRDDMARRAYDIAMKFDRRVQYSALVRFIEDLLSPSS